MINNLENMGSCESFTEAIERCAEMANIIPTLEAAIKAGENDVIQTQVKSLRASVRSVFLPEETYLGSGFFVSPMHLIDLSIENVLFNKAESTEAAYELVSRISESLQAVFQVFSTSNLAHQYLSKLPAQNYRKVVNNLRSLAPSAN